MMRYVLTISALAIGLSTATAQRIDTLMHIYTEAYPREKVYLHLDRSAYNTGESIWYKAYVTNEGVPSALSKNVFVELLDDHGRVLDRNTAPLVESSAAGSFVLPASYKATTISLRAYTRYMLNYDSAFLYYRTVRVLNTTAPLPAGHTVVIKTGAPHVTATAGGTQLRFFPEGGDYIDGVDSRVAFKATGPDGLPVEVQGTVVDAKGVKKATFASVRDGMGTFIFTPVKGMTYQAVWKDKAGTAHTTPLPAARPNGVSLSIDSQDSAKIYTVEAVTGDSVATTFHLIAHTGGQVFYLATLHLQDGEIVRQAFNTASLPSGIVTVTIFDADWQPVAERISFVDNNEYMFYPAIHALYTKFDKRAENQLEIEYADQVKSNLSVSVTDADLDAPEDAKGDNIISNLLLTSDLRGKVYKPWDYISNPIDSVRKEVDLVMLTNGWRRYDWNVIVHKAYPRLTYMPDSVMSLRGAVYGVPAKMMKDMGTINLITDDGGKAHRFLFAEIDTGGNFQVPHYFVFGQQKIYYQFNKRDLFGSATVRMDNGLFKGVGNIGLPDTVAPPIDSSVMVHEKDFQRLVHDTSGIFKVKNLATIVIKAPTKSPEQLLDEKYASGLFSGGDGYQFDVANDPVAQSMQSVFQYLQGRVAGLQITTGSGPTSLTWRGGSPGLYLDEMPVDAQTLQNISMTDVAYIKVFRPPFMGMGGANGGIAIYTKKGEKSAPADFKSLDNTVVIGYTAPKEFYSPDYASIQTAPPPDSTDLRPTLFWQPFVLLDTKTRRAKLDFFNNDITKRFKVVVEGITADGRWAHKEMIVETEDTRKTGGR
ncbi:hypothetical protein [Dinghuibacter silviterrae]|uniref:TonB-dependent receptor-like protein n=1 Tax=Dinghuibacter silviterrae TaxID=1539049 RepID=A0A4R8DUH1_9BACT|nr:hypothetical protein [Dinghuibacter silviterrae]TDX01566.1 hypothetical protein EDB95_2606 [Dinghuibacter silviterrae]